MNKKNINYSLIAVCSKDLDLINIFEYCHSFNVNFSDCLVLIIGHADSNQPFIARLKEAQLSFIHLPENDLYARLSKKYLTLSSGFSLKKIMIVIICYFFQYLYRHFKLNIWNKTLQNYSSKTLLIDLWRTKVPVINYINFEQIVVIDGGSSSQFLKLLTNWRSYANKSDVLMRYLHDQKFHLRDRKNIRNSFLKKIYTIHCKILYGLPINIINKLEENWPSSSYFFSAYADENSKENKLFINSYSHHKKIFESFPVEDFVLVLGHPNFKTLNNSLSIINMNSNSEILYLFHPRDRLNFLFDKKLKEKSESVIRNLGWKVLDIQSSLEAYLYERRSLPKKIIAYENSAMPFIETVLDGAVTIQYVEISDI